MDKRNLIINITGLNGAHFKCMHMSKEAPIGQHKESSHPFSGKLRNL